MTVPPELRARIGKRELSRSTGTGDKRVALRVAMRLTAEAKQRFAELRQGRVASSSEITAVTRQLLQKELARQRAWSKGQPDADKEVVEIALDAASDPWRDVLHPEGLGWRSSTRQFVDSLLRADHPGSLRTGTHRLPGARRAGQAGRVRAAMA